MKNKLQFSQKLSNQISIKQTVTYVVSTILIVVVGIVAFVYFNLGNSENAYAAPNGYTSNDNKSGLWKEGSTWIRTQTWLPETPPGNSGSWTTDLYGIVTYKESDPSDSFFYGGSNTLNVYDTLIIDGDAILSNSGKINVMATGVLIVRGKLTVSGSSPFKNNGRVVVTGDMSIEGSAKIQNTATGSNGFYLYMGQNLNQERANLTELIVKQRPNWKQMILLYTVS